MEIEERVQVDHMTVTKNGRTFKHFQAWEQKSKILVAQVYSRARSKDAANFLKELVERANRILREEFYENPKLLADSIGAIRYELQKNAEKI